MNFPLPAVAAALGALTAGCPSLPVTGWSVDSRSVQPGDVFFAIRGPHHDAHQFVADVLRRGAVAAVVDRPVEAAGTLLQTQDSLEALQSLAAWARQRWGGRLVAVTGSAGKTTTKEVIAWLIEGVMPVGRSAGNFNNHVGLPLSILRLPSEAPVAVVEIGMNHAGEIRRLASIAAPNVGVVTNVGHAHVEFFDSIEQVALAKRELIESLPPDGVAVLNADDPRVARFAAIHPGRSVTFGLSPEAQIRACDVEYRAGGLHFRVGDSIWFEAPLEGVHGVLNLLAGIAVAGVLGIEPERLTERARSIPAGEQRGRRLSHQGITIIDDCYNSNPEAAQRMLELLRAEPARRRVAVLGEMLELGRWSESLHRAVGCHAAACGIDVLIGIRGAASHMVQEAVKAGIAGGAAFFFEDPVEAGEFLRTQAREGDALLFKGSRGTHVEKALERFMKIG
jgi:UDP-N-acetylmuramoyl-tripeptide--D-alanyl-D-alanine ligase